VISALRLVRVLNCSGVKILITYHWIDLAQDRYRLSALVNAVMNFRVP
jgi:hypothetical protein